MPAVWGAGQVTDAGRMVGAAVGNTAEVRRRAVRYVAGSARDAGDAALLLQALGLQAVEGKRTEQVA
jgi:hypothetical protein